MCLMWRSWQLFRLGFLSLLCGVCRLSRESRLLRFASSGLPPGILPHVRSDVPFTHCCVSLAQTSRLDQSDESSLVATSATELKSAYFQETNEPVSLNINNISLFEPGVAVDKTWQVPSGGGGHWDNMGGV